MDPSTLQSSTGHLISARELLRLYTYPGQCSLSPASIVAACTGRQCNDKNNYTRHYHLCSGRDTHAHALPLHYCIQLPIYSNREPVVTVKSYPFITAATVRRTHQFEEKQRARTATTETSFAKLSSQVNCGLLYTLYCLPVGVTSHVRAEVHQMRSNLDTVWSWCVYGLLMRTHDQ